mmetsp:Transcript_52856/g.115996  ORF Transcript_52856/g.115996 Transcript_52856/m.115996 type:complete len:384 (-) Transcript_52856:22-1173(-)
MKSRRRRLGSWMRGGLRNCLPINLCCWKAASSRRCGRPRGALGSCSLLFRFDEGNEISDTRLLQLHCPSRFMPEWDTDGLQVHASALRICCRWSPHSHAVDQMREPGHVLVESGPDSSPLLILLPLQPLQGNSHTSVQFVLLASHFHRRILLRELQLSERRLLLPLVLLPQARLFQRGPLLHRHAVQPQLLNLQLLTILHQLHYSRKLPRFAEQRLLLVQVEELGLPVHPFKLLLALLAHYVPCHLKLPTKAPLEPLQPPVILLQLLLPGPDQPLLSHLHMLRQLALHLEEASLISSLHKSLHSGKEGSILSFALLVHLRNHSHKIHGAKVPGPLPGQVHECIEPQLHSSMVLAQQISPLAEPAILVIFLDKPSGKWRSYSGC